MSVYLSEVLAFETSVPLGLAIVSGWYAAKLRYRVAATLGFASVIISLYAKSFSHWISKLGADSFVELSSFETNEALNFVVTLSDVFEPSINRDALIAAIAFFFLTLCTSVYYNYSKSQMKGVIKKTVLLSSVILIGVGFYHLWYGPMKIFVINTSRVSAYQQVFLGGTDRKVFLSNKRLGLVVYIGESTSVMNMSLYGYFRNTTPDLLSMRETPGLIVFENVSSTHSHTTPSLAEALSIPAHPNSLDKRSFDLPPDGGRLQPIEEQKRISVVDIIVNSGKSVFLFSNQNQSGSTNVAAREIFERAVKSYSRNTLFYGNLRPGFKPFDGDYFKGLITKCFLGKLCTNLTTPPVVFLHSYAGHNNYYENIPAEHRKPVDELFKQKSELAVFGMDDSRNKENLEQYDAAIKYIDSVVVQTIREVEQIRKPIVFLYFSDHGESPFTGRGHDSSRYVHEMTRVPFLIYFNQTAREEFGRMYFDLVQLAAQKNPSTLRSLSATLLFLLGAADIKKESSEEVVLRPIVGEKQELSPIMIRKTVQGVSGVELVVEEKQGDDRETLIDGSDAASRVYALMNSKKGFENICSHRSNTLARIRRAAIVGNCIEIDIVVRSKSDVAVLHPPALDIGVKLNEVVEYAISQNKSLWIDGKNLGETRALCNFVDVMRPYASRLKALVELPSNSIDNTDFEFSNCARALRMFGFPLSYYVPTKIALDCAQHIRGGGKYATFPNCIRLKEAIDLAVSKRLYSDISFNAEALLALGGISSARELRWNTWYINPSALRNADLPVFRNIILESDRTNWN